MRSKCGTDCSKCRFRDRFGCKGCAEMNGHIFWGECSLYACAEEKGCAHCGKCEQFPCAALTEAIRTGHQTGRMENLHKWREEAE